MWLAPPTLRIFATSLVQTADLKQNKPFTNATPLKPTQPHIKCLDVLGLTRPTHQTTNKHTPCVWKRILKRHGLKASATSLEPVQKTWGPSRRNWRSKACCRFAFRPHSLVATPIASARLFVEWAVRTLRATALLNNSSKHCFFGFSLAVLARHVHPTAATLWPSGLRRWLKAPFRKGVGSNPTGVIFFACTHMA